MSGINSSSLPVYEISKFSGGISDFADRGIPGAFKFGSGLDIRKVQDSLSCRQDMKDEGVTLQSASPSISPSTSISPSASPSPSASASISPSASVSPSAGGSLSKSPSASRSPSASKSPSASASPSGSVSPSPSAAAGLSIFKDLILWFVPASDGNLYGFGNTGYIYKRTPDGSWSTVYKSASKIKGACEKPSAGGKTYLLWALNTELHRKELPGLSNWNDVDQAGSIQGDSWPKTNLSSQDWHTMKVVAGDVLIANGPSLAMAAYDDSFTNDALDLIPGNIAKTLVERVGRAIIGTVNAADPNNGINAAIDTEVPLAQVGTDGSIYYANMTDSISVKRFPGGGKVNPGGMVNEVDQVNFFEWEANALSWINKQAVGNMALFGVYGADAGRGGIYSFGRYNKNHQFVMNCDYQFDADEIGALARYNGLTIFSYRIGSGFGVKVTDLLNKGKAVYEGLDFRSPVKPPVLISTYKYIELFMLALPASASVEFWYKINKNGPFVQAKVANGNTTFSVSGGRTAVFSVAAEGQVYEPRVVLNPSGNNTPEVYRIRTFFQ